jgi:GDP-L-fucose synthase
MKLLITGGTGFLGKHVAKRFTEFSFNQLDLIRPSSKGLNLLDREFAIRMVVAQKPDIILHMAAVCGGILANKNSPADFLQKNIEMASNLFEAARQAGCTKIYTLGSVCAYPKFCSVPFKEDDLWNGYPEETNAPYGIAKRTLLMLGQTYRQQYNIGGAHLIPVNLYGEHDHFNLINSHVIPALIRKFEAAIETKSSTVECWGTGEATREFLYAGDAANAIVKAIVMGLDTDLPINLGTGTDISIRDLAYLIKELTGFTGEIVFNGSVSDGQPKRMLDITRAKEMLDWNAETNLRTGIIRTIDWYRHNKKLIIERDAF